VRILKENKEKMAVLIPIYKNPEQTNRFIKQLITNDACDVYIHIDKKNYTIRDKIIKHPQVKVLEKSVNISWGDISLIDAMLLMMNEVINSCDTYYYIFLRTGQDLIIKNGLSKYIREHRYQIFMNVRQEKEKYCFNINVKWPDRARKLYDGFHLNRIFRLVIIKLYEMGINVFPNTNKLPSNFRQYHGSSWFGIPYTVLEYIILFLKDNPWYYDSFKNCLVPDEWFFQTLIMNSPFAANVANDNLLYIDSWENNHPKILKEEHIGSIIKSEKFFARKFDEKIDNKVIDYFCNNASL
jgi:hypothetical protein